MLRTRGLKLVAVVIVKIARGLFKLPNGLVAAVLFLVLKIAQVVKMPKEAVSDINDAYCAMRDGPPLSEPLRTIILDSDPDLMANVIFGALHGDTPLEEVDPW